MALPSVVTVASAVIVVAAGVNLGAVATGAGDPESSTATQRSHRTTPSATATEDNREGSGKPKSKQREEPQPESKVLVDVFNNSGITGLASDKAALLQGAGWNVAGTDDWYGDIPASTVYYPPKLKEDARRLAKVLDVERLHPAVAPMQFDRLTVIFTSA
jgi:hypothetical protein